MLYKYACDDCGEVIYAYKMDIYSCRNCNGSTDLKGEFETVCVAWLGYNHIKSYLGVFDNKDKAKKAFLEAGCEFKEATIVETTTGRKYNISERIVVTEAFTKWLSKNALNCKYLYSTGGNMVKDEWPIEFDTIPLNMISRGYDDD